MVRDLGNKQRSQLTKEDDTKEKEKRESINRQWTDTREQSKHSLDFPGQNRLNGSHIPMIFLWQN